jgi:hypothetical protein
VSVERTTYRFGPLERRGLIGAIRPGQAGILVLGLLVAVVAIDSAPSVAGAFVGMLSLCLAAALTSLRVGGRAADEWTPIVAAYALRRAGRRSSFRSDAPQAGMHWSAPRSSRLASGTSAGLLEDPKPQAPPGLRGVAIAEATYRDRRVAALVERGGRRLTSLVACRVVSFALLDPEAQERRLAQWGLVLSGAAAKAIRRIQWIERTAPAQGDELARWLHDQRDPAIPLRGVPIIESYLELIASGSRVSQSHEILVAVQVDVARLRERSPEHGMRALVEATEHVVHALEAAEIDVLGALGRRQVARVLRTAFDPYAHSELATLRSADETRHDLSEVNAWPLGAREAWDHYRCDGAVHATYWIGGWPRTEVSPMFMDALLGGARCARTVAVTFEPIRLDRSAREAEAAVTRDRADRELRWRFGQMETARQRQSQEAAARREAELAAGHAEVRLAGFITVSGRDEHELRRASSEVMEHGARARLELHRMFGQQADAFTFTLPLARGLR